MRIASSRWIARLLVCSLPGLLLGADEGRSQKLVPELISRTDRYGAEAALEWYKVFSRDSMSVTPGVEILNGAAQLLLADDRPTDALVFLHEAAGEFPASVDAQFIHAEAHRMRGDEREIDPVYGLMFGRLAVRNGAQAAIERFQELRRLPGPDGSSFELSAAALDITISALMADERMETALAVAEFNAGEFPQSAAANATLGGVRLAVGDTIGAIQALEAATRWTSPNQALRELREAIGASE